MLDTSLRSRRALLLAGTSLLLAVPTQAFAQEPAVEAATPEEPQPDDTAPTPGNPDPTSPQPPAADEIVVTGIRRGIQSSLDTKRREQGIVEAVSAEDIGKLPDVSIAESIARLPGLAAQRVNGRAQYISIRGLAPDFTSTLLNGRQLASSGDNRAVEFDQYPSELLASVVIYKTPDANIAGFGLSGTADLRTIRPLSFKNRTIAVNLRGELNEDGHLNAEINDLGARASISYIDRITPELGFAVGVAASQRPQQARRLAVLGRPEQRVRGHRRAVAARRPQLLPQQAGGERHRDLCRLRVLCHLRRSEREPRLRLHRLGHRWRRLSAI